ncbi:MAG: hypothetical protein ACP5D3_00830, partial [Sulfurovum sp.]
VVNPMNMIIDANGLFGEAEGSVNVLERGIRMKFSQRENLGVLSSKLKKDGEGWLYETSF